MTDWTDAGSRTWADLRDGLTWDDLETHTVLVFTPPVLEEVPRVSYPISAADERFWSHFQRGGVGQNIYKLVDGTFTTIQPTDPALVAVWYLGGHLYVVDETERDLLAAQGYTVEEVIVGGFS